MGKTLINVAHSSPLLCSTPAIPNWQDSSNYTQQNFAVNIDLLALLLWDIK